MSMRPARPLQKRWQAPCLLLDNHFVDEVCAKLKNVFLPLLRTAF
jgi:hypothetical protein